MTQRSAFLLTLGLLIAGPSGAAMTVRTIASINGWECGAGAAEYKGTHSVQVLGETAADHGKVIQLLGQMRQCSTFQGIIVECSANGIVGVNEVLFCETSSTQFCKTQKSFKARSLGSAGTAVDDKESECFGVHCPMPSQ